MGCKFCASTGIPFVRSLTAGEIVEQILAVQRDEGIRISNIVFMGIGEPLDNYDNVVKAIRIINNPKGLEIGARHISVSTSGLVPKIYSLADEQIQCTLSISLHSPVDEKRSEIMPVNKVYNIEELIKACKYYIEKTGRRVSFEYAFTREVLYLCFREEETETQGVWIQGPCRPAYDSVCWVPSASCLFLAGVGVLRWALSPLRGVSCVCAQSKPSQGREAWDPGPDLPPTPCVTQDRGLALCLSFPMSG